MRQECRDMTINFKLTFDLICMCAIIKPSGVYKDTIMTNKLLYILNDDTKNYLFCRLQLV